MRISGNKHSPYFDPVYSRHPDIKVLLNGYEPRQRALEACEEEGWIIVYQITANGRIKAKWDTVTKRIEPLTETLFGEVKIVLPKSR